MRKNRRVTAPCRRAGKGSRGRPDLLRASRVCGESEVAQECIGKADGSQSRARFQFDRTFTISALSHQANAVPQRL
jgi:hypothetical protein